MEIGICGSRTYAKACATRYHAGSVSEIATEDAECRCARRRAGINRAGFGRGRGNERGARGLRWAECVLAVVGWRRLGGQQVTSKTRSGRAVPFC